MDFRARLLKAAERGKRNREAQEHAAAARARSEEEWRRLHSSLRLPLSEHIERCLNSLADNFPGFQVQTIVEEEGWGTAVMRDDVGAGRGGRRSNFFSRLKVLIGPFNQYHVLDISAKGTVRNKETFQRSHYEPLDDVDEESFRELIELWVLDYAEAYAAVE